MQMRMKNIVGFAAMWVAGVSASAPSTQAPSPASAEAPGSRNAAQPGKGKTLHDGLSPSVVNRAEKRKVEVPAAMRSVPVEVKVEFN